MAGTLDLSLSDLNDRFTAAMVKRVFCDNGSNQPGSRYIVALRTARRLADAVLLAAWSEEQIQVLVEEDDAVRSAILDIALSEGMAGRIEWDTDGGPREKRKKAGLDALSLLAKGQLRSIAENHGAGANPHLKRASVRTERTPHSFVFAPSRAKPSRGGF